MARRTSWRGYAIWFLGGMLVCNNFYLEVVLSTMTPGLMRDFHITATGVGELSAILFIVFMLAQMPAGYLIDRFPLRGLMAGAALVNALSCFAFANATTLGEAFACRVVQGLAAAFPFVSFLKAITLWFPSYLFALMLGIGETINNLSVAAGQYYAGVYVPIVGWRNVITVSGYIMLGLALLLFFTVREPEGARRPVSHRSPWTAFRHILFSWRCWGVSLFGAAVFSVFSTFNALWGIPFLEAVYGYQEAQAALAVSFIYGGLAVGCPLMGWLRMRYGREWLLGLIGSLGGALIMAVVIGAGESLSAYALYACLFLIGVLTGAYIFAYEGMKLVMEPAFAGFGVAFCNIVVVGGALLQQPLVGWLLDIQGHGSVHDGMVLYPALDHQLAMASVVGFLILGGVLAFSLKGLETHAAGAT